jgi:hypothetical protein
MRQRGDNFATLVALPSEATNRATTLNDRVK